MAKGVIIALIVVVLAIGAYFIFFNDSDEYAFQRYSVQDCEAMDVGDERDFCYFDLANANDDPSLCDELSDSSPYSTNECLARATGDESYCEKMEDYHDRDSCIWYVAIKNNDPSMCEKLNEKPGQDSGALFTTKFQCLVQVSGDISYCDNVPESEVGYDKDSCILDVAIRKENPSICKLHSYSQGCKDFYYLDLAYKKNDPSMCEKISEEGRDLCYFELARGNNDPSLCEKLSDNDFYSIDDCVAQITGDISYCDNYDDEDPFDRDSCIFYAAVSNGDPSLCQKLSNTDEQYYPVARCLAEVNDDASYCEDIIDPQYREECVSWISLTGE